MADDGSRNLPAPRIQGPTTKELLLEVQRYVNENMKFIQRGNEAAGAKALEHLEEIIILALRRRAEIAKEVKG